MTNDHQPKPASEPQAALGLRLQTAREALGLDRKDAATQLRLNEKIILMLETGQYAHELPTTFIFGYLRSYAKLLSVPWDDIQPDIALIKQAFQPSDQQPLLTCNTTQPTVTSSHYFMQLFTYAIVLTLIGLVGSWWYNHATPSTIPIASNSPKPVTTAALVSPAPPQPANNPPTSSLHVSSLIKTIAPPTKALPLIVNKQLNNPVLLSQNKNMTHLNQRLPAPATKIPAPNTSSEEKVIVNNSDSDAGDNFSLMQPRHMNNNN